ncbi:MAG TPA: N-acetylglucosamine-6-phosphate deacetylase [Verrucomicrobiae bacterium]
MKVIAKDYRTGKAVEISWEAGKITGISPLAEGTRAEVWLAPVLIDVQVNGYAGIDFQQDDLTEADLLKAVRGVQRDGCGLVLLTLITDEWSRLLARLKYIRALRDANAELKAGIAGWHIEGPFLSPEPGFKGAHNAAVMCDATVRHIDELLAVTEGDPVLLTVASERAGSAEAIRYAASKGIKISLGHTNASAESIAEATKAGAVGFTHLGNGCPRTLDRHDNIVWRVLDQSALTVGIIPDRIHVSPEPFRLFYKTLGMEQIYYTTDAMAAAGAPPGRYRIGAVEVEVGADQVVRLPGQPNFAGSALSPLEGVQRTAEMLGEVWQTVWPCFSTVPARMMGLDVALEPGKAASFCLIETETTGRPKRIRVILNGEEKGLSK